jgi:magnesium-protoporphyrin O-methyltransferase
LRKHLKIGTSLIFSGLIEMSQLTYQQRRGEIQTYFDRTAAQAWERLTSNEPVGRIRATVRAGRDQMRTILLSCLPQDMRGMHLLDAGCGTGAFAEQAALRGARVTAIDLSPTMVDIAAKRLPEHLQHNEAAQPGMQQGSVRFVAGDMLDSALGEFDYVVGMDSLIHYQPNDMLQALRRLEPRVRRAMIFTFAPRTALLSLMHSAGKMFPRSDRAPSIVPIAQSYLLNELAQDAQLASWQVMHSERVSSGFYTSHALAIHRSSASQAIDRGLAR